jgi:hypothetical protein
MLSATFFDDSARRGDVPPKYRPLKAERIIEYRTVEEQLPDTTKHKAVVSKRLRHSNRIESLLNVAQNGEFWRSNWKFYRPNRH